MHPSKSLFQHLLGIYPRKKLEGGQQRGIGRSMCSTLVAETPALSIVLKVITPAWKNRPDNVTRCELVVRYRVEGGALLSADVGICHASSEVQIYRIDEPSDNLHWERHPQQCNDGDWSVESAALDRLDGYIDKLAALIAEYRQSEPTHQFVSSLARQMNDSCHSAEEIRRQLRVPQFGPASSDSLTSNCKRISIVDANQPWARNESSGERLCSCVQ